MSDQKLEIVTGALVVALAVGVSLYAARSADLGGFGSLGANDVTLTASFRSADGVSPGTDVRLAGVKIGTVAEMRLNPETYRADAILSVTTDVPIPDDSIAAVSTEGLLGGTFIEVLPGGSPFPLEDGFAFVETQASVSLVTLLSRFVTGGGE